MQQNIWRDKGLAQGSGRGRFVVLVFHLTFLSLDQSIHHYATTPTISEFDCGWGSQSQIGFHIEEFLLNQRLIMQCHTPYLCILGLQIAREMRNLFAVSYCFASVMQAFTPQTWTQYSGFYMSVMWSISSTGHNSPFLSQNMKQEALTVLVEGSSRPLFSKGQGLACLRT